MFNISEFVIQMEYFTDSVSICLETEFEDLLSAKTKLGFSSRRE